MSIFFEEGETRRDMRTGADLGISRGVGGADFQKNFENFVDLFLVDQIEAFLGRFLENFAQKIALFRHALPWDLRTLSRPSRDQLFDQIEAFLGTFWKILPKKSRFFGTRSHGA